MEELRLKGREDYVEALDAVFTEAVAAALRSNSGAAVLLSGGIDSSYVASVAAEVDPNVRGVTAYSATLSSMDERQYSRAVAERIGMNLTELEIDDCWSLSSEKLPDEVFDQPNVPMQAGAMAEMARAGAASGETVLIDGVGGDEWFTGSPGYIGTLFTQGRFARGFHELSAWGRRAGYSMPSMVMYSAVLPLIPAGWRDRYRALRGRAPDAAAALLDRHKDA